MAEFKIEIAGQAVQVQSLFESTRDYCRKYLTEREADFALSVSREDLAFEQEALLEEARQEGIRPRIFTDPFLERTSVQNKIAEQLLMKNVLMLHGSVVAVDGYGYLFTARCGTGKSTHTRLWRQVFGERAIMVNDDKPFVRIMESGALACGSPWSGKHGLDTNITVPLKGICILERGAENRIARISVEEALPMLVHQSYHPANPELEAQHRKLITLLADKTLLWRMQCNKDPQAAVVSHAAMSL